MKIFVEGACVLDPTQKFFDDPIIVFDFASLYPSMIITLNLSPELYIPKQKLN